ncbi:hypothetical protein [Ciceribacter selenitireducens]|uniref:Uncharacterized protein n=1 Tax=Ciceribacter selenitireducens ATCC BAA-1503 TaxID=1336235 RepID=A0A376AIN0_9HYPH|nr:hypothetical protein [Ciceribacter selenitireducens]SSC67682.1 unnamed protein product [Ciceribacter selenitireducens ATCC BAA-1503]
MAFAPRAKGRAPACAHQRDGIEGNARVGMKFDGTDIIRRMGEGQAAVVTALSQWHQNPK